MQTLNNVKVSFNFNLRQPKKKGTATPIYCVAKIGEKQIKMPCGLKVYAYQWDGKKQMCIVSTNMGDTERENNIVANRKINQMKCTFDEIFYHLCDTEMQYSIAEIESYIKNTLAIYSEIKKENMTNKNAIPPKRTVTATTLLKKAFELYYTANGGQKESTIKVQRNKLNKFLEYIKVSGKGDSPRLLTQDGLNDYKEYLINLANESEKTKLSAKVINQYCQLIARLINDKLTVNSEFRKYNLQLVRYVNIADTRRKEEKYKRALTEKEVDTFMAYSPENEKEKEIKDLFILQMHTGVRKGDLVKLVTGDYMVDAEETDYIIVETEKEGITAVCEQKHINEFNAKYPNGLQNIDINTASFESTYNKTLKTIFKKCGLNSEEKYKVNIAGRNVEKTKPLCELISTHFARHTFITFKLREGLSPDVLCNMTGHADDRMIREVYEHLTKTDKIRKVKTAQAKITHTATPTAQPTNTTMIADTQTANVIAAQAIENYNLKKEIDKLETEKETNEFNAMTFAEQTEYVKKIITGKK